MDLHLFSKDQWNQLAKDAHVVVFGEIRETKTNTFDFAMMVTDEENVALGYATIIEMDNETAYMQHGGAFPSVKGTTRSLKTYIVMLDWLKANYRRITTRIENKNLPMLKLAMSQGLLVHGCDCYPNEVFLHLRWEK